MLEIIIKYTEMGDIMRIKAPNIYMQEKDLLSDIGQYVCKLSDKFFVIIDNRLYGQIGSVIEKSLSGAEIDSTIIVVEGVCTEKKVEEYAAACIEAKCRGVMGIGSGGVMDLAKAVAFYTNIPVAVVPTLASSDAPCSSVSVLYDEDARFLRYLKLGRCPNMVLADSELIANAPARFLAAGMADGLSTYLENQVLYHAEIAGKIKRNTISPTVMALSRACYDVIMEDGLKALADAEQHFCSDEVERVIEANIYMSGVGFENGGLAAVHSVANCITHIKGISVLHGEAVAIGILAQMVLQGMREEEMKEMRNFLTALHLPVCLSDLGVTDIRNAAETVAIPASSCYESNQALLFSMQHKMIAGALMALEP